MARGRIFNGEKARELRTDRRPRLEVDDLVDQLGNNPKTGRPWHPDTIRNAELGHAQPSDDLLNAWADALGVHWRSLLHAAWDELPNLHAARLAWLDGHLVRVTIRNLRGELLEEFDTNDERIARRRTERARKATPSAEVAFTPLADPRTP